MVRMKYSQQSGRSKQCTPLLQKIFPQCPVSKSGGLKGETRADWSCLQSLLSTGGNGFQISILFKWRKSGNLTDCAEALSVWSWASCLGITQGLVSLSPHSSVRTTALKETRTPSARASYSVKPVFWHKTQIQTNSQHTIQWSDKPNSIP